MVGRKRVRNPASKDLILKAAARVIAKRGPAHLTLDAVAREAGLSKGGLLYNFPTKQSLVQGMILDHVERFRSEYERLRAERNGPNSAISAMIGAQRTTGVERGTGLAMLAGIAENPDLLSPLREEACQALTDVRESATDPMIATLAWLAINGLEFLDLLDVSPFEGEERKRIEERLVELVEATPGQNAPATAKRSGIT